MSIALQIQAKALIAKKCNAYEVTLALSKYRDPGLWPALKAVYANSKIDQARVIASLNRTQSEQTQSRLEECEIHPLSLYAAFSATRDKCRHYRDEIAKGPFAEFRYNLRPGYGWEFWGDTIPENFVGFREVLWRNDAPQIQLPKGAAIGVLNGNFDGDFILDRDMGFHDDLTINGDLIITCEYDKLKKSMQSEYRTIAFRTYGQIIARGLSSKSVTAIQNRLKTNWRTNGRQVRVEA